MQLIKMAKELLEISQQLRIRFSYDIDYDEGDLYDFDQTWASTALGFGGIGGSALTTARTYVFIPLNYDKAFVFFGSTFAYECKINDCFREDMRKKRMASVMESGRYNT